MVVPLEVDPVAVHGVPDQGGRAGPLRRLGRQARRVSVVVVDPLPLGMAVAGVLRLVCACVAAGGVKGIEEDHPVESRPRSGPGRGSPENWPWRGSAGPFQSKDWATTWLGLVSYR